MKENKPTIKIYYSSNIKDIRYFSNLLWGIEEEGIPYELEMMDGDSDIDLSYKAAQDSRLDVGLGISYEGFVSLHYVKLNKDRPLFKINTKLEGTKLRALGSNTARLVKGMPLKNLEDNVHDISNGEITRREENLEIKTIIEEIIRKMGIR
ncbi:glycerol dehydratase reactivase beta/small subunit family protein [Wukongibacter baidiensis]|uniref:glycerol dehydratase reactivase beta/small subunit family protein n=1 Tax=Wukongibacter baidiensis TaxID=1723361 RepID=UPI003D7F1D12